MIMLNRLLVVFVAVVGTAASAPAAVIFTVTDTRPGETANTIPTSSLGTVASTAPGTVIPTTTYTITGLDLTSVGGGTSETIAFDVDYSQTGGSAAQVNGFGNISVTGGDNNQIDLGETLTAMVSLNSTTFGGVVTLGLVEVGAGGVNDGEMWNVIHDGGTIAESFGGGTTFTSFPLSSFVTLETTNGTYFTDQINFAAFGVEITAENAVPEPASLAGGLLGLALIASRRRCRRG